MVLSSMSNGNAALACINLVYFSFKVDKNKGLWLLFLNVLFKQGCASYGTGCNAGRKGAIINVWIIKLAKTSCSSVSKGATLGCFWSRPIFTVCSLIVEQRWEWINEVAEKCKYVWLLHLVWYVTIDLILIYTYSCLK